MGPGLGGEPEAAVDDPKGAAEGVQEDDPDQCRENHRRGSIVEEFPERQLSRKDPKVGVQQRVGHTELEISRGE